MNMDPQILAELERRLDLAKYARGHAEWKQARDALCYWAGDNAEALLAAVRELEQAKACGLGICETHGHYLRACPECVVSQRECELASHRDLLRSECMWWRTIKSDPETAMMAKSWMMDRLDKARAAVDAAGAMGGGE